MCTARPPNGKLILLDIEQDHIYATDPSSGKAKGMVIVPKGMVLYHPRSPSAGSCHALPWFHDSTPTLQKVAAARFNISPPSSPSVSRSPKPTVLLNLRTKSQSRRQTKNLDEFVQSIKKTVETSGGRFVFADTGLDRWKSTEAQVKLYNSADVILYMCGASAANLIYTKPGALVVEIQPGTSWNCLFSYMQPAASDAGSVDPLNIRWHYVILRGSTDPASLQRVLKTKRALPVWKNATLTPKSGACAVRNATVLCNERAFCAHHELGPEDSRPNAFWTENRNLPSQRVGGKNLGRLLERVLAKMTSPVGRKSDAVAPSPSFSSDSDEKTEKRIDSDGVAATLAEFSEAEPEVLRAGGCRGHAWELFEEADK